MDLQLLNDTGIWACLQLHNGSILNRSLELPNGTCEDALLLPKIEPARAKGEDLPTNRTRTRVRSRAFVYKEVPKSFLSSCFSITRRFGEPCGWRCSKQAFYLIILHFVKRRSQSSALTDALSVKCGLFISIKPIYNIVHIYNGL